MKRFSILLLINFLSLAIYAQTFANYGALGPGGGGGTVKAYVKSDGTTITRNPYLFKSWENNSTMTTKEGKDIMVPKVNFDVVNSRFVAEISNDSIFAFYNIEKVIVNSLIYEKFKDKFYQVLFRNSNNIVLLKDYALLEKKAMIHATTNTILKPAEFVLISKYYVILDKEEIQEAKLNKKSILSLLNKKEESIMNFVKKNRLSYTKEEDAIDIFKFYATL